MSGSQGGDVEGMKKIDVSQGEALSVAAASFDPGYDLSTTLSAGNMQKDALVRGYCDYGTAIGEGSKK